FARAGGHTMGVAGWRPDTGGVARASPGTRRGGCSHLWHDRDLLSDRYLLLAAAADGASHLGRRRGPGARPDGLPGSFVRGWLATHGRPWRTGRPRQAFAFGAAIRGDRLRR